jgi:hypothetical protein
MINGNMKENKELKQLWRDNDTIKDQLWRYKMMQPDEREEYEREYFQLLVNHKGILDKIEAIDAQNIIVDSIDTCNITRGDDIEHLVSCMSTLDEDDWNTGEDFEQAYIDMVTNSIDDEYNSK